MVNSLTPKRRLASNFSRQYHPEFTHYGHKNKGNDQRLKNLLIVTQILLSCQHRRNVYRAVWRKCILMSRCKGLRRYRDMTIIDAQVVIL